jgi:hypothetical protein
MKIAVPVHAHRNGQVAGCPAAASAQLCAVASHSTTIPQPWLTSPLSGARIIQQHSSCNEAVSTMVCRQRPKSFGTVQNVANQI